MERITTKLNLQIRGIDGQHSESEGDTFDVSNSRRLGKSENELLKDMVAGIKTLIKEEKKLMHKQKQSGVYHLSSGVVSIKLHLAAFMTFSYSAHLFISTPQDRPVKVIYICLKKTAFSMV